MRYEIGSSPLIQVLRDRNLNLQERQLIYVHCSPTIQKRIDESPDEFEEAIADGFVDPFRKAAQHVMRSPNEIPPKWLDQYEYSHYQLIAFLEAVIDNIYLILKIEEIDEKEIWSKDKLLAPKPPAIALVLSDLLILENIILTNLKKLVAIKYGDDLAALYVKVDRIKHTWGFEPPPGTDFINIIDPNEIRAARNFGQVLDVAWSLNAE